MTKKVIVIGVTDAISFSLIKGQAEHLTRHGYEVHVISAFGQNMERQCTAEGAIFHPIPFVREISLVDDIRCFFLVLRIFIKLRPQIINCGTPKAGFICMAAGVLAKIPNRILTLRGLRSSTLHGAKRKIVRTMEYLSCRFSTLVLPISPSLMEEAVDRKILSPEKCKILGIGSSNGLDLAKFNPAAVDRQLIANLKNEYGINEDNVVIGFVGRVVKSKGVDVLVNAFEKLESTFSNRISLVLIGRLEEDDAIEDDTLKKIETNPNIHYLGKRPNIHTLFPLFDIFVLPSYREGFGNVIIEASSLGIPVVATKISGCKDAVEDGCSGLLFEPGNVDDLVRMLKRYLVDPRLRIQHGEYGHRRTLKYFDRTFIHKEQLALYESCINNAKSDKVVIST